MKGPIISGTLSAVCAVLLVALVADILAEIPEGLCEAGTKYSGYCTTTEVVSVLESTPEVEVLAFVLRWSFLSPLRARRLRRRA